MTWLAAALVFIRRFPFVRDLLLPSNLFFPRYFEVFRRKSAEVAPILQKCKNKLVLTSVFSNIPKALVWHLVCSIHG